MEGERKGRKGDMERGKEGKRIHWLKKPKCGKDSLRGAWYQGLQWCFLVFLLVILLSASLCVLVSF